MRDDHEREYVDYVTARRSGLHRAAYLMCGDGDLADDIVQATITSLYGKWHRAQAANNIEAYVYRILVRKYLDEKRNGWSRVLLLPQAPEAAAQPTASVEEREAVQAALAHLPRTQRTVLVLRFVCDMAVEDVATVLRCSPSNVKSHTARGLAALRHLYETDQEFAPDNRGGLR